MISDIFSYNERSFFFVWRGKVVEIKTSGLRRPAVVAGLYNSLGE